MGYQVYLFNEKQQSTVRVAKKSFKEKHKKEDIEYIKKNWESFKAANKGATNEEKGIFYASQKEEKKGIIKVVPSNYASFRAALALKGSNVEGVNLRPHFVAGVIIVCRTSDGYIIVGSRDANRDKNNPNEYPAQFPCGFIDADQNVYKKMQTKQGVIEVLKENAKRELKEEVLNFKDEQIKNIQPLGGDF